MQPLILDMEDTKIGEHKKISLIKIENEAYRYAMFLHCHSGIYKKVNKLIQKCNMDVGIVVFAQFSNPSSFFHEITNAIINHFLNHIV